MRKQHFTDLTIKVGTLHVTEAALNACGKTDEDYRLGFQNHFSFFDKEDLTSDDLETIQNYIATGFFCTEYSLKSGEKIIVVSDTHEQKTIMLQLEEFKKGTIHKIIPLQMKNSSEGTHSAGGFRR